MIAEIVREVVVGLRRGAELADARAEGDTRRGRGTVPAACVPAAAALVAARPELAGVGITDAIEAVVYA